LHKLDGAHTISGSNKEKRRLREINVNASERARVMLMHIHTHTFATPAARSRMPDSSNNILCCEWAKEKVVQTRKKNSPLPLIVSFPSVAASLLPKCRHCVYPLEKKDFQM
jgi:hypothetical protein